MEKEIYEAVAINGQTVTGHLEKIDGVMYIHQEFTFGTSLVRIILGTERAVEAHE